MKQTCFRLGIIIASLLFLLHTTDAVVKLPAIFGDHMVLQQGILLPIWGKAAPGETVKIAIGETSSSAVADDQGNWMVKLQPLAAGSEPVELHISAVSGSLTLHDVLIGDVWLASGQSNMELGITNADNATEAIAHADRPLLRIFVVAHNQSFVPQDDMARGQWLLCTPETVQKAVHEGVSAAGYFFASEIQSHRKIPVGLVQATLGGTTCEAWTSLDALQTVPALAHHVESYDRTRNLLMKLKSVNPSLPPWQDSHYGWNPRDPWTMQYNQAYEQAVKQGMPEAVKADEIARKAQPNKNKKPDFAGNDPKQPGLLFNGMIHPLIPFGIKGVIWYQGEQNAGTIESSNEYGSLFPTLIKDWRNRWGKQVATLAEFPFVFVQLPGWDGGWNWPIIRAAQAKALSLPNTAMAVTIDVGEEKNIHPRNKEDVGHRLALAARHVAYREDLVYSGPVYQRMAVEGSKVRLWFMHTGGGLAIGRTPRSSTNPVAAEVDVSALHGFTIAGKGGQFVLADAVIDGDTVVLSSNQVPSPTAVRYAWIRFPRPMVNLYNKEGLPAAPFATDIP